MFWIAWPLRAVIAFGAARVLLHGTVYLSNSEPPDEEAWTPMQIWLILGALGFSVFVVWALLTFLTSRVPSRSIPVALALTCAGAGAVMINSGYATGGPMGLTLSAGLIGAVVASLLVRGRLNLSASLGVPLIALFALLVSGRFFAELTTTNAILLFFAPLLCWLPALTPWQWSKPFLASCLRLALVAVPVVVAGILVLQAAAAKNRSTTDANSDGVDEYSTYKR